MPIIHKPSSAMFLDVLNAANPAASPDFSSDNVQLFEPKKLTTGNVTDFNSRIKVKGKNNVYVNSRDVDYRRMDVAILTRGISLVVPKYFSPNLTATPVQVATLYELLPILNRKYGLYFTEADFPNVGFSASIHSPKIDGQYSASVRVAVKASSPAYYGTVNITWVFSPPTLSSYINDATRALSGRTYPGGNDFTGGRKPVGEWQIYGLDATAIKSTLDSLPANQTVAVNSTAANVVAILNWLNDNTDGIEYTSASSDTLGGLGGLAWARVVLPSVAHPEAYSAGYNRALIITGAANSWFTGKLILHYNT